MSQVTNGNNISAIFFDLDNTIIQTREADRLACNKLTEILWTDYDISKDIAHELCNRFLQKFRQCPDNPEYSLDTWRLRLWSEILDDKFSHYAGEIYSHWLKLRYNYLAIPAEISYILNQLHKSYQLAVISNGPSSAQWEKIQRLHLQEYFDLILISGDLPWEKPSIQIFQKACSSLGVKPDECVMVGDRLETDILGGKAAQLASTIWMPATWSEADSCCKDATPDYTIQKLDDILNIL